MTAARTDSSQDSQTVSAVVTAAARAAALVPATVELVPGAPVSDPDPSRCPPAPPRRSRPGCPARSAATSSW